MLRLSTFTAILVLPLALVACDAANGSGSEGASSAAAAGNGDATQAQPTAVASSQPPECVSGLLQTARFAGGWNVENGEAWFGGQSTRAGTNDIILRASGNDLTMTIAGFPTIRMQRVPQRANYSSQTDPFRWEAGPDTAVSSQEAVVVFGCENMNQMARFQGQVRVDSDGVSGLATFRLVMTGTDGAILHWEMASPMSSSGLFNISRAS